MHQDMSVCGGMQPTTAPLTVLLEDESEGLMKSIQSRPSDVPVLARAAENEPSHQLSQDRHMDLHRAKKAVTVSSNGVPVLGEGGGQQKG